MTTTDTRAAIDALTVEDCERIFHGTLAKGDMRGVEAALTLLAIKDPDRAQELLDTVRIALLVADAGERPAPQTPNPEKPWLWLCGCLINDGRAHRRGCPDFPEGRR